MNAHAQAYMADTPMAARRALLDAISIYGNDDGVDRQQAITAIASGRPAFWTTVRHSSQRALALRYAATQTGGVVDNLLTIYPDHLRDQRETALDTLVPLDLKAAVALSLAYAEIGLWRDEPELLRRAKRDCRKAVAA